MLCGASAGAMRAQDTSAAGAANSTADAANSTGDASNGASAAQDGATTAASAAQQSGNASAKKPAASANSDGASNADGADPQEKGGNIHTLSNAVTIQLSVNWAEAESADLPPPPELRNYSPPFHLTSILSLQNVKNSSVLQLGLSDNPLLGHDSNWLDEQMHKPAGSGMSVLDLMYYYFFPPSEQCMVDAQNTVEKATFAPSPAAANAAASGANAPSSDSTNPELQLTYHCKRDPTLDGFYAAQLSNGITFVQSNSGPRAFSVAPQFYLVPMERVQTPGMTWFVFEAQRTDPVPQAAERHFRLAGVPEGAQADYFWAIGAPDPFPFTADGTPGDKRLIHAGYATVSLNNNRRAEFIHLLNRVQVRATTPAQ
jgi:hypothetical protein